jgi:hypothetical protein
VNVRRRAFRKYEVFFLGERDRLAREEAKKESESMSKAIYPPELE